MRSLDSQKQSESDDLEAAERPVTPKTIESMVKGLQHKREKHAVKGLTTENPSWKQRDGMLYHKNLLYIPKDEKIHEIIIQQNHNHPLAGHSGVKRTRDLILGKYYWPTLRKDIEKYVAECDKCQKKQVHQ